MPDLTQDDVSALFRRGVGAAGTTSGPSQQSEAAIAERQHEQAVHPPSPSPAQVTGQVIGGTLGAELAPEAMVGGAVAAGTGAIARGVLGRTVTNPRTLAIGSQLLRQVIPGTAQFATRAAGAGTGLVGASEFTHSPESTPEETAARRQAEFTSGVVGEGIGGALHLGGKGISAARAKLAQQFPFLRPRAGFEVLEKGAQAAQARLRQFGGNMMAGQMTKSFGIDALQNIAQASFSGGGTILRQTERNLTAAEAALADAGPKWIRSISPQDAGKTLQGLIERPLEAQKAFVRAAYENFDAELARSGNVRMIDLRPIRSEFEQKFSSWLEKGNPTAVGIRDTLALAGDDLATFGKTEDIRQMLGEIYRSRDLATSPGMKAVAGKIIRQIDEATDQAAQTASAFGPRLAAAAENARSARTTQAKFFDDELIGPLLEKAKPEEASMALWQANNPSQVEALRNIVFEPRFRKYVGNPKLYWEQIQSGYFQQLRRDAGQTHYGSVDGKKLGDLIDNSNGTFEALFPDKIQRDNIRVSARAMEMIQAKPGGTRSGSVLVQMAQGRDVGSMIGQSTNWVINLGTGYAVKQASAKGVASGLGIYFAPMYLAKVLASRPFSDWIMRRAIVGASGTAASSAFGQLVGALMKTGIPFTAFDDSGTETSYDPQSGATGPGAPMKPQSKYRFGDVQSGSSTVSSPRAAMQKAEQSLTKPFP